MNDRIKRLATAITQWIGSPASLVIHTWLFALVFILLFFWLHTNEILLILTTAVSIEAIYLSLFIQMTVNRQAESLEDVEEDIDEIQDDIEEISEDIEQIQEEDANQRDTSLDQIEGDLKKLLQDINVLRHNKEVNPGLPRGA